MRAMQDDYRSATLDEPTRALMDYAVKMTRCPSEMRRDDIEHLRAVRFDDETILDAVQAISYFNYSNRVMDALGIQPEPGMRFPPPI